jgi:ABC-type uncharacterized transport system auxiliary subunit
MRPLPLIAAVSLAALLAACATKTVRVIDVRNVPVSEAMVEAITPSMNLTIRTTDTSGKASLPLSPQNIEWVSVRKIGFEPSGQVPVHPRGQTTVILQSAK